MKKNNNQIDNTSYYLLPCGKMLEDFIYVNSQHIGFHMGNAIKYFWRAGKKYGESSEKDMAKCYHYAKFIAQKSGVETKDVLGLVDTWCRKMEKWDGITEGIW